MGLNIQARHAGGLASTPPQPEDVFLSWLLAQPAGTNLGAAAEIEIRRLQRYQGDHPGPRRLVALFEALQKTDGPEARASISP